MVCVQEKFWSATVFFICLCLALASRSRWPHKMSEILALLFSGIDIVELVLLFTYLVVFKSF